MSIFDFMVGILLLTITIFVHRHTYSWLKEKRLPFPRWLLLLMVVVAVLPVINLLAFILGIIAYIGAIILGDIEFYYKAKWWKSIVEFFNKEI